MGEESPIRRKLKSKNEEERMEALKFKEKQEKLEKELNSKAKSTKKEAEKMMKSIEEK